MRGTDWCGRFKWRMVCWGWYVVVTNGDSRRATNLHSSLRHTTTAHITRHLNRPHQSVPLVPHYVCVMSGLSLHERFTLLSSISPRAVERISTSTTPSRLASPRTLDTRTPKRARINQALHEPSAVSASSHITGGYHSDSQVDQQRTNIVTLDRSSEMLLSSRDASL